VNYTTIRDKLTTDLTAVTGIGKVFGRPRWSVDWTSYLNLFKVTNPHDASKSVVNLCWVSRRSFSEFDSDKGSRDEAEVMTSVQRDETWEIMLIYGFDDDDTYPSETDYQGLVDAIATKFRLMDQLGIPATVEESWPIQLESSGLKFFGDVLCHNAVMTIRIQQRINS
jgi:hypothetical protein